MSEAPHDDPVTDGVPVTDGEPVTDGHEHPPHLAHHFDTPEQQYESGKLGMWLFLVTEVLLFGGLFCWYAVARANNPEVFLYGHHHLDKTLGGINTIVLICSSLTMAWAVRCAQLGNKSGTVKMLALTLICAFGFLGIKAVEYDAKIKHGLLPGRGYHPEHSAPAEAAGHEETADGAGETGADEASVGETSAPGGDAAAAVSEKTALPPAGEAPEGLATGEPATVGGEEAPANPQIFWGVYFVMTGVHALHVLAGMAVIFWLLLRAKKGHFSPEYFAPVDFGGLYWHVVDVIWIFLFPLLYLIA